MSLWRQIYISNLRYPYYKSGSLPLFRFVIIHRAIKICTTVLRYWTNKKRDSLLIYVVLHGIYRYSHAFSFVDSFQTLPVWLEHMAMCGDCSSSNHSWSLHHSPCAAVSRCWQISWWLGGWMNSYWNNYWNVRPN